MKRMFAVLLIFSSLIVRAETGQNFADKAVARVTVPDLVTDFCRNEARHIAYLDCFGHLTQCIKDTFGFANRKVNGYSESKRIMIGYRLCHQDF